MAIAITPEITGNSVDSTKRYKYIFEPLRVQISEAGSLYTVMDIELRSLVNGSLITTYNEYVFSELSVAGTTIIDLNKVARNFMVGELYKIGATSNITHIHTIPGFYLVFKVKTNKTTTPVQLMVVPLIGGRSYRNFTPSVTESSPLTEWEVLGITQPDFKGYPKVAVSLKNPTLSNIVPTVAISTPTTGRDICGGYLIWKSTYGGWMSYGFEIGNEVENVSHQGEIDVGLFDVVNGNPYIQANYTGIESSMNVTLKSIGVSRLEAEALKSLNHAPVVYYMKDKTSPLELMRVSSVSIPISNLMNGSDVTVSLNSISVKSQTLR